MQGASGLTVPIQRQLKSRLNPPRAPIRDNGHSRRYWVTRPRNEFTERSYVVVPDFLSREECTRIRDLADRHLSGPSHVVAGNCYTWVKKEARHGRNASV